MRAKRPCRVCSLAPRSQQTRAGRATGASPCRVPLGPGPLGPGPWHASLIRPFEDTCLWGPHRAVRWTHTHRGLSEMSVASGLGVARRGPSDHSQGLQAACPQTRGASARQPRGEGPGGEARTRASGEASARARPRTPVRPGGRGPRLGAPRPRAVPLGVTAPRSGFGGHSPVQSIVVTATGEEAGEEGGRAGHSPGTVRGTTRGPGREAALGPHCPWKGGSRQGAGRRERAQLALA